MIGLSIVTYQVLSIFIGNCFVNFYKLNIDTMLFLSMALLSLNRGYAIVLQISTSSY